MEENKNNNSSSNSEGKKTLGRRKIELKKIEKKTNLQVTFSKRRLGLFKKASEISVLCGAEIALLVRSPANKIYAFGNPSVESILNRFETGSSSTGPAQIPAYDGLSRASLVQEDSKRKHDNVVRILEVQKDVEKTMLNGEETNHSWYDDGRYKSMGLDDLIEYGEALKELSANVSRKADEIEASNDMFDSSFDVEDCFKDAFIGSKRDAWPDQVLADDQNQKERVHLKVFNP